MERDNLADLSGVDPALLAELQAARSTGGFDIFEVSGAIKWFDASKGYGFIVPDNGLQDVLLHQACLRAGGYDTANEGARVHAQVLRRPKGLQVYRILSLDESTAIHASQLPQRAHINVKAESNWERAQVKWFNRVRGFGFLTRGEGTDSIFVHMEILRRFGFEDLRPGQTVLVRWGYGAKGCMAAELRPDAGQAESIPPLVPRFLPSRIGLTKLGEAVISVLSGDDRKALADRRRKLDELLYSAQVIPSPVDED